VSAEDHALAGRHLIETVDENRAFSLERLEHEAIVYDLMADVERTAVSVQCAAHSLDRSIDPGAKAARLRQDYFLNRSVAEGHR
jgi:hypothetical protein